jgi:hypothetical protein
MSVKKQKYTDIIIKYSQGRRLRACQPSTQEADISDSLSSGI